MFRFAMTQKYQPATLVTRMIAHWAVVAALVITSAGCSVVKDLGEGGSGTVTGHGFSLDGFVQKGPFIQGSDIRVSELGENFKPNGRLFSVETTNDTGAFDLTGVESEYVEIAADGFYFNEVTGLLSDARLSLRVLAQLSNDARVNVNVLTTIGRQRIKNLMQTMPYAEAREQAHREVLALFHIPQADMDAVLAFEQMDISAPGTANAVLLAASITMQGSGSVAELSELLAKVGADLASDGRLDDVALAQAMTQNAMTVDLAKVRDNLANRYAKLDSAAVIPDFEQYVDSDGDQIINKLDYQLEAPTGRIRDALPLFSWSASAEAGARYTIEVATDADFTNLVGTVANLEENNGRLSTPLEDGASYHWRVLLTRQNGDVVQWAPAASFLFELAQVDTTPGLALTRNRLPSFSWQPSAEAAHYTFLLSLAEDGSNPVRLRHGINASSYTLAEALPQTPNTTYYWSVAAVDAFGVQGKFAPMRSFVLDTVAPEVSMTINGGAAVTARPQVEIAVLATEDEGSVVTEMAVGTSQTISADDWAPYNTNPLTLTFDVSENAGTTPTTLTAYVTVRDAAGNTSAFRSDSIDLKRTAVSGILGGDTTWDLAGSPYVITADLGVPSGTTLSIDAGVEVYFDGPHKLGVNGAVQLVGTAEAPIKLTRWDDPNTPESSSFLEFEHTSLDDSSIRYVHFTGAASTADVRGTLGDFWAAHDAIRLLFSATPTDPSHGGTLVLEHARLTDMGLTTYGYASPMTVELRDSVLANVTVVNNQGLVLLDSEVRGGQFELFLYGQIPGPPNGDSLLAERSTFEDVTITTGQGGAVPPVITFRDTTHTGGWMTIATGSALFERVTMENHFVTASYAPVDIIDSTLVFTVAPPLQGVRAGTLNLDSTSIRYTGSEPSDAAGVALEGSPTTVLTMTDSDVHGFDVGVRVSQNANAVSTITGCNLDGNDSYALVNEGTLAITATNNYWGATDATGVADVIQDGNDLLGVGLVTTTSFVTEPFVR